MTADILSISSNTFGFIMGSITLLGLIINVARFHLPSNKIKVLESLLDETETFFRQAVEDGLLIEPNFIRKTEEHLTMLKDRTFRLQSRAYNATTLSQDYAEFFRGTSTAIGGACHSLKKLRAEVISSSEEGRRRLMEMNSTSQTAVSILPPNLVPQTENQSTLPIIEIARPHSCPPSLSTWATDNVKSVTTPENPFDDPTQSDTGIQIVNTPCCAFTVYTSANLELEA